MPSGAQEIDRLPLSPRQELPHAEFVGFDGMRTGEHPGAASVTQVGGGQADEHRDVLVAGRPNSPAAQLVIVEGGPFAGEGQEVTPVNLELPWPSQIIWHK
ncbi:hypothetical protein GCM10017781_38840 [Deinococcus metalli]|uniref:Uncharacterized protein n=1 Tax=Deinococcus metalli TaxID=1141878 RepID=A0ABQ3JW60_9DEIO|nr:hypothetical protein GCM10017781_38840 [Deinococcus metalli]